MGPSWALLGPGDLPPHPPPGEGPGTRVQTKAAPPDPCAAVRACAGLPGRAREVLWGRGKEWRERRRAKFCRDGERTGAKGSAGTDSGGREKRGRTRTRRHSESTRAHHTAAEKAAGEKNGKGGRGRGYEPRRGTVDGQYFAPLVQWSHETEEGAAKSKSPPAPPISMLRQKGGPSKWTIFRTSASPSFQLQH